METKTEITNVAAGVIFAGLLAILGFGCSPEATATDAPSVEAPTPSAPVTPLTDAELEAARAIVEEVNAVFDADAPDFGDDYEKANNYAASELETSKARFASPHVSRLELEGTPADAARVDYTRGRLGRVETSLAYRRLLTLKVPTDPIGVYEAYTTLAEGFRLAAQKFDAAGKLDLPDNGAEHYRTLAEGARELAADFEHNRAAVLGNYNRAIFVRDGGVIATPSELARECNENEIAFIHKYKGRRLIVDGKVKRIDADFADNPVIWLSAKGAFLGVMVRGLSIEAAIKLRKGKPVTVICESVSEVGGTAALSDCAVAS